MPTTLIQSNPTVFKPKQKGTNVLQVAEFFCNTIQGEGVTAGVPSSFLRLEGCTLDCVWCDTAAVWKTGNPYTFKELFAIIEAEPYLIYNLALSQHLILTGGSPLKQQDALINFLLAFKERHHFLPYIEVENEAVLKPDPLLVGLVDQWNNSPKLANSQMKERARYKPDILRFMSSLKNSWFKFVVETPEDWTEIKQDFLDTGLIQRDQVILMPCGENQELLNITRPIAAEIAVNEQVRFSDRLHVTIWDKKTGV